LSEIHSFQLSFFAAHAPFDKMDPAHLLWMIEHMQLGYYAEGEVILSPEQGAAQRFLVIKQGLVQGEQNVSDASEADTWLERCWRIGRWRASIVQSRILSATN
jgi:CBS domain-containing protein